MEEDEEDMVEEVVKEKGREDGGGGGGERRWRRMKVWRRERRRSLPHLTPQRLVYQRVYRHVCLYSLGVHSKTAVALWNVGGAG